MERIEIKDIYIIEYSAKSIAIFGNTKPVKEILKICNAKYNQNLTGGCGWIASKAKKNIIVTRLKEHYKIK